MSRWPPAGWPRVGNIRGRLILLSCVAALPVTGLAATIVWQSYQAVAQQSQERAALIDGQALAQLRVALTDIVERLAVMGARYPPGQCAAALKADGLGDIVGLLDLDLDGHALCRAGDVPPLAPPAEWFEQVRGGAEAALGMADGFPVLASRAGADAVAVAVLQPGWIAQRLLLDVTEPGGAIWLLDADRAVLASRGDAAAALPTLNSMVRLVGADQVAIRARSAQGLSYAYATTLLPNHWRLIAATSAQNEHDEGIRNLLVRMAELAALLLVGFAAVILGADVAFGSPIRRLTAAVRRWQGGGAFDPGPLPGAPDEVADLARSFRDATGVLRQREAELVQAKERQDLLVLEIHHRVKNNLQVVASLLNLQASRIRMPEARAEFQAARDRVRALATLHRHLYADGALHTINMRSFLTELCGQLFQALGEKEGERIRLLIEAPELRMSSDQAVPLSLIVTEAVTNSMKYAFPDGRRGTISVTLSDRGGALDLVISDDGVGIVAGKGDQEPGRRDGIGLQLIRGFSRQLGAALDVEEGDGTRYAVRLQARPATAAPLDAAAAGQDTVP